MDCTSGKCYGVLAVHRICFALTLFHALISLSLIGVQNTKDKRAAIQNGWWGPKVLLWFVFVFISFLIPNGFFAFWGNYISIIGATIFILLGLVLLVDFAHSWTETCLENWENTESELWKWILIGSAIGTFLATIVLTTLMFTFFAGPGCTLNRFFIGFNLALCIVITIMCIHPAIQEANPRSGLVQAGAVSAYCTYLIMSAVANHSHKTCNPLQGRVGATEKTTVALGALFTFLAIAYSTTRAATQSKALIGKQKRGITLDDDEVESGHATNGVGLVSTQPKKKDSPRYQALLAAVEAGAIPASALDEEEDEEDEGPSGEERDDERTGTRYNYSWFHAIFVMGAMYVAMLLTDWNVVRSTPGSGDSGEDITIGRSEVAMWIRVVSSWICIVFYGWSLVAPVVLPDRFGDDF